jgi:hypothetical protein
MTRLGLGQREYHRSSCNRGYRADKGELTFIGPMIGH